MRPLDKSKYTDNQQKYEPYGDAKFDLINALGAFCSYCEREGFSSALDVEHIEDKKHNPEKKYLWSNFLLACKNCNSIKGTKVIDFDSTLLPHLNDTFEVFDYLESGFIKINPNCTDEIRNKTANLMELIGLERRPGHPNYSNKDSRWEERKKCWETATRYLKKYTDNNVDIEIIIDLALKYGFWSIWMTVFFEEEDVKQELIAKFSGTNQAFFYQK